MPEKAKELQEKLHQWQNKVGAQPMQLNPAFDAKKRDWRLRIRKATVKFFLSELKKQ
jgi:hypothetical protein